MINLITKSATSRNNTRSAEKLHGFIRCLSSKILLNSDHISGHEVLHNDVLSTEFGTIFAKELSCTEKWNSYYFLKKWVFLWKVQEIMNHDDLILIICIYQIPWKDSLRKINKSENIPYRICLWSLLSRKFRIPRDIFWGWNKLKINVQSKNLKNFEIKFWTFSWTNYCTLISDRQK